MLLILAFLFLFRHYGTSAAPVAASTHSVDPSGYDISVHVRDECPAIACPGRSVWDIVWSCLATTFWVSVHPNVPHLQETSWMLRRRRIFLMCLALLAPEVMIIWAFKQWREAVMIKETVNKARPKSYRPWTMTHAHFLQMRGFKLCTAVEEKTIFANKYKGYQCQVNGIDIWEIPLDLVMSNILLKKGKINLPDVSEEEINDRSKGDVLSKGVALLQITWFILQLIARARQQLTITEIELTTAALAGLNSIMYLFWWSKPLDVRFPIAVRTKELERLLVVKEGKPTKEDTEEDKWSLPFADGSYYIKDFRLWGYLRSQYKPPCINPANLARRIRDSDYLTFRSLSQRLLTALRETCDSVCSVFNNSTNRGSRVTFAWRRVVKWIWMICKRFVIYLFYLPYGLMFLPTRSILDPAPRHEIEGFHDVKDKMHSKSALQILFDADDLRWIMDTIFNCDSKYERISPFLIFSAIVGAGFGSIHCAAWHFDFPSSVERILWQTASLSLVGICLSIITGIPLYNYAKRNWYSFPSSGFKDSFWMAFSDLLQAFPAIVYSIARISLLVLSLLSLRRLPPSALDTVTWTAFIPHI